MLQLDEHVLLCCWMSMCTVLLFGRLYNGSGVQLLECCFLDLLLLCLHRYGFHITKASYFICHDPKVIQQLFDNLRNFDGKNTYPKSCGRFKVSGIRDLTTGYDSSQPDQKAVSIFLNYM